MIAGLSAAVDIAGVHQDIAASTDVPQEADMPDAHRHHCPRPL
jgi:hypothetical protein